MENYRKNKELTNRIGSIDVYKGISILCITLLHYEDGIIHNYFNIIIGSFMIFAFYFSTGWLYSLKEKIDTLENTFKKRLRSIGIPYIAFSIIYLLFDLVLYFFDYYNSTYIAKEIYKTLILRGIGTLWFLPALFWGEIFFLFTMGKKKFTLLLLIIAIASIELYDLWVINYRNLNYLYQIIDAPIRVVHDSLVSYIIITISFYIGTLYKLKKWDVTSFYNIFLIIPIYAFTHYNIVNTTSFGFFLGSFTFVFAMFIVSSLISKINILKKFLSFWGRNSLILMLTHYSIILVVCDIINQFLLYNTNFKGGITLVFFFLTLIIEYPIIFLMNKHCKFILGKG